MVKSINKTLTLIEDKLQQSADNSAKSCDIDSIDIANIDLAKEVGVSSMYLQKPFILNGTAVEIFKTQITDQRFGFL